MSVTKLKGIFFILSLAISFPLHSADCLSESPTAKDGTLGEMTAKVSKLSSSQIKQINDIFKSFKGKRKGIGEYMDCVEKGNSLKEVYAGLKLEGEVESKKNELRMVMDLKVDGTNTTRPINMRMVIEDGYLRHNTPNKSGDIEIVSLNKNLIHYFKKYRGTAGSAETIQEQVVILLRKSKSEFILEQRYYEAGKLFGKELWLFKK